jgi:hypothetical protein
MHAHQLATGVWDAFAQFVPAGTDDSAYWSALAQVDATLLVALVLASRADVAAHFDEIGARLWARLIGVCAIVLIVGIAAALAGIDSGETGGVWKFVGGSIPLGAGLSLVIVWAFMGKKTSS